MNRRAIMAALLWTVAWGASARADEQAVLDKIVALNKTALATHASGDHQKAKDQLLEAVVLAKENNLSRHPVMARTYLHLGVVHVEGLKEPEKGVRQFGMAIKVRSDIEVTPALATKAVVRAFDQARAENGLPPSSPAAEAAAPAKPEEPPPVKEPPAVKEPPPAKEPAASKELAAAREREKKEREEKERVQKQLADASKQLADARGQLVDANKKLADAGKQLADANKQLAETGKQLTDAKGQLAGASKQLTDAKGQLADAKGRETKERETREALEKEKQAAAARESARKKEEQDRAHRMAGPDLPGRVPQALYCPVRDEAQLGQEIFVHCATQPGVKEKAVVLHYRPSGVLQYDSLSMERTSKGWYTAVIPASRATGRLIQFYVEAHGTRDDVAANNGRAASPNLIMLKTTVSPDADYSASPVSTSKPKPAPAAASRRKRPRR